MKTQSQNPHAPQSPEDLRKREIRSFVVRAGRMSDSQSKAIETLMPRYGIEFDDTCGADLGFFERQFGRAAPLTIEIGFGMGVTTVEIAARQPERDFLGIEVHPPGVGNALKLIEAQALTNVRIIRHDAVEVLRHMVAAQSVDAFHIYFPDPWHKLRHHKRRLLQAPFVALLASRLKRGGYVHLATDWEHYAQWMLEVLQAESSLKNSATDFAPKPAWRPTTKFETRGVKLGHGVWDLLYTKV
jgi:tRNA (guanine-N7-)-methyltransferase